VVGLHAPAKGDNWTFANFGQPDSDFGCPANLFQANIGGAVQDVIGRAEERRLLGPQTDDGTVLWKDAGRPRGPPWRIHWGAAVDGKAVYVGVNDETGTALHDGRERPAGGHEDERRLLGCARSGRRPGPTGASNKGQICGRSPIPR